MPLEQSPFNYSSDSYIIPYFDQLCGDMAKLTSFYGETYDF